LLSELLANLGIEPCHHLSVFLALDKRGKLNDDQIAELLHNAGVPADVTAKVFDLMAVESLDAAEKLAGADSASIKKLRELFALAELHGFADRLVFDISVIRGLSYYTGIVFEAFDTAGKFRAIFGGGRYDNLLTSIGGNAVPAVGLGFGDVVIVEIIQDLQNELAQLQRQGVAIGFMFAEQRDVAVSLAARLRASGTAVDLALSPMKPKAFFSRASNSTCESAVFIGPDDVAQGSARIKNLSTRVEEDIKLG
jgi:histidyl-tRNA synthetase